MVSPECDKLHSFIIQINYILLRAFSKIVNNDLYLYDKFKEVAQHSHHFLQVLLEQIISEGLPITSFSLQAEIVTNHCQPITTFPLPLPLVMCHLLPSF
jgi:hypothetical protein